MHNPNRTSERTKLTIVFLVIFTLYVIMSVLQSLNDTVHDHFLLNLIIFRSKKPLRINLLTTQ